MIRVPVGVEYQRRLVWQQGEGRLKISAEATVNQDGLGPSQPCEVAAGKEPGSEVQPVGQGYRSQPCSLGNDCVNEAPRARSRRRGPLQARRLPRGLGLGLGATARLMCRRRAIW